MMVNDLQGVQVLGNFDCDHDIQDQYVRSIWLLRTAALMYTKVYFPGRFKKNFLATDLKQVTSSSFSDSYLTRVPMCLARSGAFQSTQGSKRCYNPHRGLPGAPKSDPCLEKPRLGCC